MSLSFFSILGLVLCIYIIAYISCYIFFQQGVKKEEHILLDIYLKKISKVPALIEVMRPYIHKQESFQPMIDVHTESMISSSESLYDILSHNGRLQNEFLFLMKLSVHAPELQKHEYFLYIRDFMIQYERTMRSRFAKMNQAIVAWNNFIRWKKLTLIGYLLPGRELAEV